MAKNVAAMALAALAFAGGGASPAAAQSGGEPTIELLPPIETVPGETLPGGPLPDLGPLAPLEAPPAPSAPANPPLTKSSAGAIVPLTPSDGAIVPLHRAGAAPAPIPAAPATLGDTIGYDTTTGSNSWIIAHDNRFGMVSLESLPTLPHGHDYGLVLGLGFHFLDGPIVTDMPPRLFDFSIGYQVRMWLSRNVGFDVVARVGAYSDFETTARKGVRFPSHGVAFVRMTPSCNLLLGIDELDRDDISLLPVFGAVWQPYDNLKLDAVFPRPKAAVRLGESDSWAYVRGQLGGGTWAIERAVDAPDNATYRDLRLALGVETNWAGDPRLNSSLEVAYLFARELTYRSGVGDLELDDAVMIGLSNQY